MKANILFLILFGGIESAVGDLLYPKFYQPASVNETLPPISQEDIINAFNYAEEQHIIRMELENKYVNSGGRISNKTVGAVARMFFLTLPKSMETHRVQEKLEDATKYISERYNLSIAQKRALRTLDLPKEQSVLQECEKFRIRPDSCDTKSKYRTLDGSCNNLQNPNWGRAFSSTGRMTLPDYADGIMSLRTSKCGESLPNPRVISTTVSPDVNVTDKQFTLMLMSLGQYIVHDLTLISTIKAGEDNDFFECCPTNISVPVPSSCISVQIPDNDIMYTMNNQSCQSVIRTTSASLSCKLGIQRQPVQQQNSFIDASIAYGATEELSRSLRTLEGGQLRMQDSSRGSLPPGSLIPDYDLCSKTLKNNNNTCFLTGDPRSNLHPGILGLQILALRMHNEIARMLSQDYPNKTDEELFQEARRIVGSQINVMTYKDYLPTVLGARLMTFFDLQVKSEGYTVYDPNIDPTTPVELVTGAFRFAHSTVDNFMSKVDSQGTHQGDLDLHIAQSGVFQDMFYEGEMDYFLRGNFHQRAQHFDRFYVDAMNNHCMKGPDEKFGLDLVVLEIQRGREHGLPSYTAMVKYCFNDSITTFDDLKISMTETNIQKLRAVYSCVEDVDFYMGGLLETRLKGGVVGPTFACVIGKHFHDLKFGDRFYFEHGNQTGSYTENQLKEIRKMSLAGFICQYSDNMGSITVNPLRIISKSNPMRKCNDIPRPNFTNWFDK